MSSEAAPSRIVRLNVGGKLFLSSKETLEQSDFFRGLLSGTMPSQTDENGCFFIDRNPRIFRMVLEMLRTGVLFWDRENELRACQIECDFFLLKEQFQRAVCPIRPGLYSASTLASQPWILFVETMFDSTRYAPCTVFLTGVVDEEVLLRHPATLCCAGFLSITVRNRTLSISAAKKNEEDGIKCSWTTELLNSSSGDRILTKQSDPESTFPVSEIPLKQKLTRTKSKSRKIFFWFEKEIETGEILLWKQRSDGRTYSNKVTVLCPSLFIFSNREPLGVIFLSARVPFLIKRRCGDRKLNDKEGSYGKKKEGFVDLSCVVF